MKNFFVRISYCTFISVIVCFFTFPAYPGNGLFQKVIDAHKNIRSIDSEITQFIFHNETIENFSGRYRVNSSGFFRIDYTKPERQLVLKNKNGLQWYFPEHNLLYIINERSPYPVQPGGNPIQDIVRNNDPRFTMKYAGTHMYGFFTRSNHFIARDPAHGVIFTIITDAARNTVLEKIISNSHGKEILHEHYSNYHKFGSQYFPCRVDVIARTAKGIIRNTTFYRNVRLNHRHSDTIFSKQFSGNIRRKYIDAAR